jgi:tellurite resistance protein
LPPVPRLDADTAILALLIAAMASSGHVAPEENARADNIIWGMRRFREKSGEAVGRKVERVKTLIETHGLTPVVDAAAQAVPAVLGPAVFAVAADVVLVDGRFERPERLFLERLAADLGLDQVNAQQIVDVIRVKNSA